MVFKDGLISLEDGAASMELGRLLQAGARESDLPLAVVVDEYKKKRDGLVSIEATIHVSRPSHKGMVIGKGGAVIRALTEETGAVIDIDEEGNVKISSSDLAAAEEAKRRIEQITSDAEVGVIYSGTVKKIMDFGAFVEILPGKDGLVHISQISEERVENVSDKLSEGDVVKVKVLEIDRQGRIRLSMKEANEEVA